jgi:Reverse transcriptase (RNA-dependent DNA polymerase)
MDQEQENSSLEKKRITTSSQIKTVIPTMHQAHPRRTMTLTAMMKLMIRMTTIKVSISHRSMAAKKTPAQGCSHTTSPSHAPEDDDDPDDVQLNPQTTEGSNNSGGSYAAPITSHPHRARKPVDRYTYVHLAVAQSSNYDTPKFREALQRDDAEHWRQDIVAEIDTLKARGTWTLVPRPKQVLVLPCKVLLKIKRAPDGSVDRYKARLVALGCLQKESDYDETFSPVVDFATVRTALTAAVYDHEKIHHIGMPYNDPLDCCQTSSSLSQRNL